MKIQRTEDGNGGKFYIEENGKQLALMTYKKSGDNVMTIDHTEVDDSLQGKGIGNEIVEAGVRYARENNLKIIATCPFAKKVIDKTPEFQDVLADKN